LRVPGVIYSPGRLPSLYGDSGMYPSFGRGRDSVILGLEAVGLFPSTCSLARPCHRKCSSVLLDESLSFAETRLLFLHPRSLSTSHHTRTFIPFSLSERAPGEPGPRPLFVTPFFSSFRLPSSYHMQHRNSEITPRCVT